ncbi:hypothetical protein Tco_0792570 [Tanacetum coccineum]
MADVNALIEQAPAVAPPTRTDEQILPCIRWVPIGKSNCYLDAEKSQNNPIYKIAVDILKQTNFFRAFTASLTIPAIYIQQFWDSICYDRTAKGYKCQLDEQWFNLTKDTLRDALRITPVNNNKAFSSPPTQDTLINFVNDLGYLKEVKHLSNVVTNDMFQPWRSLTTIINLCLTRKTSGFERPRAPVLQILWGIINRAHIDYAERMWEEFTQSIHTFTEDKKNLAQHTQGKKKATLIVIPSVSAKRTKREVFGMPIPNELITDDIQGADYYDAYLEKVAKHQRYLAGEEVSDPDSPTPKPAKSTKPKVTKQSKPIAPKATTKKPQPAPTKPKEKKRKQDKEITEATPPAKRAKAGKVSERCSRCTSGPFPPVVFRETDTGKFQPLPEVEGKGKEKASAEQAAQRRTSAPTEPSGHDESSSLYAELDEGQAGPNPGIQDEGQAGPNPGNDTLSQTLSTPGVHAGPNLEHTDAEATDAISQPQPGQIDEEFTATAYPNVQENLKLTVDEPMILEEPSSSTRTLSSLQHLAKDFSFGDQFFNDKPPEADNEKTTADTEAESMVSVTIHQDTSTIPPMTSPAKRAKVGNIEADTQRVIEESLKDAHGAPRGPLRACGVQGNVTGNSFNHFQRLHEEMPSRSQEWCSVGRPRLDQTCHQDKGQAEPNTDDVAESQPLSTLGVHAGPNLEHTNAEATNATSQPQPGQMDEEFTITAYPNVQENLKPDALAINSSMINPQKPIMRRQQQIQKLNHGVRHNPSRHLCYPSYDINSGELEQHIADLVDANQALEERLDKHGSRLYRLENQDIPNQVSKAVDEIVTDAIDWAMQAPLRERFRDLPEADMKKNSSSTEESYGPVNSDQLLSDLAEARKKKKKRQGLPKTPPGSPPHIRILSVLRIVVFLMYGYNYMKYIVLHRADLKEYKTSQSGIESYQTQLNLTKPRWDAKGFEYKHDFIVIDSPRAVTFRDKYGVQMIMRVKDIIHGQQDEFDLDYTVLMKKDVDRKQEFMGLPYRYRTVRQRSIFWNSGKLCWWKDKRRRLPTVEENRMKGRLHKDGDADASFHFRNSDKYYHDPEECEYASLKVTTSHKGNIPQQG